MGVCMCVPFAKVPHYRTIVPRQYFHHHHQVLVGANLWRAPSVGLAKNDPVFRKLVTPVGNYWKPTISVNDSKKSRNKHSRLVQYRLRGSIRLDRETPSHLFCLVSRFDDNPFKCCHNGFYAVHGNRNSKLCSEQVTHEDSQ